MRHVQETNKFKRAWIWLWYNNITRICVLIGLPVIPVVAVANIMFGRGEYLRLVAAMAYIFFLGWALIDNDYSKLRSIGMDEYRMKINDRHNRATKDAKNRVRRG